MWTCVDRTEDSRGVTEHWRLGPYEARIWSAHPAKHQPNEFKVNQSREAVSRFIAKQEGLSLNEARERVAALETLPTGE